MDTIRNMFSFLFTKPTVTAKPANINKRKTYPVPNTDSTLATVGYYVDFTQPPVAGRHVIGNYNNYVKPTAKPNLTDRDFNCRQPLWNERCY